LHSTWSIIIARVLLLLYSTYTYSFQYISRISFLWCCAVNIEDYISKSTGKPNDQFDRVMELFTTRCGARMHWGKAGWPKFKKCFDGSQEYPNSWCDFGCAVHQLDPGGKFRSESDVWQWKAHKDGESVEFGSCCTASGFDRSQCTCQPIKPCDQTTEAAPANEPRN